MTKLQYWLHKNNISRSEFAARIGCTLASVGRYCLGTRWPTREMARAIARETNDEVTAANYDALVDAKTGEYLARGPA